MKDAERVRIEMLKTPAIKREKKKKQPRKSSYLWVSPLSLQLWQIDTHQYLIIQRSLSTNSPIRSRGVIQSAGEATRMQKQITVY